MIRSTDKKINKIVVLGGGSAGFLTATGIATRLPNVDLTVVRSTKMGVLGVGEGTIPSVVTFLHKFLGLDLFEFNREAKPSIKLGIKYLWGTRPYFHYTFSPQLTRLHPAIDIPKGYFCQDDFQYADLNSALMNFDKVSLRRPNGRPHFNQNYAYHLENKKFVGFLEKLADRLKIEKIDAVVESVNAGPDGVESLTLDDGRVLQGDLFFDCSGFRSELLGKTLQEPFRKFDDALFCDRAVVGGWPRSDEDPYHPYTTAETMSAGWAWQIEHDELVNRGYVFCSQYLSDDEAIREFQEKNPKVKAPRVIKFDAGVRQRTWVDNVVAIGNSAGFVEPIEATAIGMICDSVSRIVRGLKASNLRILDVQREIYNRIVSKNWDLIRDFIAVHYRFNNRIDSPFWQMCQNDVALGEAQEIADYYKVAGPDLGFLSVELKRDFFTAEGYVAMLLGQNVPYEREVNIDPDLSDKWNNFKEKLAVSAKNGVSMEEYLAEIRNSDVNLSTNTGNGNGVPIPLGGNEAGELNWH